MALVIAIVFSIWSIYLRCLHLKGRDLWVDEIYQYNCLKNASKPIWLHQTYGDHTSFPGEWWLNYFSVQAFGLNKWGLALGHMLILILTLWLFYRLCVLYLKTPVAHIAAWLIFTLNWNLVYHALKFRPYAVLPACMLGLLLIAHKVIDEGERLNLKTKIMLSIAVILAVTYHAYGILIAVITFGYVGLLRLRREGNIKWIMPLLGWFVPTFAIAFGLWGWYASFNTFGLKANVQAQVIKDTFEYWPNPVDKPLAFLRTTFGNLLGEKRLYLLMPAALILFWPKRPRFFMHLLFLLLLIVLPILLVLWADLQNHYWFLQRQIVWVIPAFALWVGFCWDEVFTFKRKVL